MTIQSPFKQPGLGKGTQEWEPRGAFGRAVKSALEVAEVGAMALVSLAAFVFQWTVLIAFGVVVLAAATYAVWQGVPVVWTALFDAMSAGVNAGTAIAAGLQMPFTEFIANAAMGAFVGLVIGVLRYRERRHSSLAQRVVEILGEPELLSVQRLGVSTVAGHMIAGVVAGFLMAWLGFPSWGSAGGLEALRDTPVVVWAIGAGSGFGGGFGGAFPFDWAAFIRLILAVLTICAVLTATSLALATVAVAAIAGLIYGTSQAITVTLALALTPQLPDHPFRDGKVYMPERVHAELSNDAARSTMIGGAAYTGAITGLLTATLITVWELLTALAN
ncbi:MAG: hypothetical protein WC815_18730 [Vicinamibacterales bacterium]|jgi:hypothetical protein